MVQEPGSPPRSKAVEALLQRIDASLAEDKEPVRSYIGASGIGDSCIAYQSLSLRGFRSDPPTPNQRRIFTHGHVIEGVVLSLLRNAGLHVEDRDTDGKQFNCSAYGGHFQANLDGVIVSQHPGGEARPIVIEVKSMNKSMFNRFKKHGIGKSHPEYRDQIITQEGLSGIREGIIFAYCKDNSELWGEMVPYSAERFSVLNARVMQGMFGPSTRVRDRKDAFPCSMCFKRSACHDGAYAERKCQHCKHSVPNFDGGKSWTCTLTKTKATEACDKWEQWRPS